MTRDPVTVAKDMQGLLTLSEQLVRRSQRLNRITAALLAIVLGVLTYGVIYEHSRGVSTCRQVQNINRHIVGVAQSAASGTSSSADTPNGAFYAAHPGALAQEKIALVALENEFKPDKCG